MRRAYVDIPEGQVHYMFEGEGEPLLLLHQTPSWSDEYREIMPFLAKSFRVIAMDSMGYGMSDFPPVTEPSIADYARYTREFLAAMGIKKTSVFGHHTGATIAVEFAAAYPAMVDKLVVSGCPYYPPEVRPQKMKTCVQPVITADGAYIMELWETLRKWNPDGPVEFRHRKVVAGLLPGTRREDGHLAVFRYMEQERLPLIKAPTLILSGDRDAFVSFLDVTKKLIPRSRTGVIKGAGSLVVMVKPQEMAKAITDFIKQPGV